MTFPFEALRRWPDIEAADLPAADAADRLLLDEAADALPEAAAEQLVVIGDGWGALTLGALAIRRGVTDPHTDADAAEPAASGRVRVHQDALTGERALAANAERLGGAAAFVSLPLDADLVRGAEVVLLRLPRSLDALRDIAALIAAHASPDVVVFAGGRLKHMTLGMNDVLRAHFGRLDVTHARQKSRVLIAREPHAGHDPQPARATHDGLVVCAYGGAFAGTSIDVGTRFLLAHLPEVLPGPQRERDPLIDMACGTGVVAATLALRHPSRTVVASDQSAAAVASARATAEANDVAARVDVVRDDALSLRPDDSAGFIALNPPFHVGGAVHEGIAPRLFADAARVLRPGGELWAVWNTSLFYRPALERLVGPTRQIARNAKFTVTASIAR